jgi:hypothetical protein
VGHIGVHDISMFDGWTPPEEVSLLDSVRVKGRSAIYSMGIDRVFFVSDFDLWITHQTAKLLYHKLLLHVFLFTEEVVSIDNSNCFNWTRVEKEDFVDPQTPTVKIVNFKDSLSEKGFPANCPLTLEQLRKDQEFALFVLHACYAMRLTDAILNQGDSQFYLKFFPNIEKKINFNYYADPTHWPGGFVQVIERVLFQSNSIEELKSKFKQLLPLNNQNVSPALLNYSVIFFKLLGWSPEQ